MSINVFLKISFAIIILRFGRGNVLGIGLGAGELGFAYLRWASKMKA